MRRDVVRGALWILAEVGSGEVINLIAFIVLSRILSPADYGVAALAGVVSALLQLALTRGLVDAVVARPDLDEEALSTAFWANLGLAAILFLIQQAAAGPIAWCFGQPMIEPLLRWFAVCLFTTALIVGPLAVLRRNLRFRAYAVRAAVGAVVSGALGVAMAWQGFGIWSFVGAQVGQGVTAAATVWYMGEWRPQMRFSARALRELAPFSAHAVLGAVLDFLATRVDILAVGLVLDSTALGYYYLLKRILQVAVSATLYPSFAIMMPALRRFAGEADRFNQAYISFVSVTQTSWVMVATGLLVCSPDLIPAVFGPRWVGAIPLLQSASLLGLAFAISFCTSQALGAAGHVRAYIPIGFIQVVVTAVLVGLAAQFGVVATGIALALSSVVSLPFNLASLRRHTGLDPAQLLRPCIRIIAAGGVAAAAVLLARLLLLQALPGLMPLLVAVFDAAACVMAYGITLWLMARGTFHELARLARTLLPGPSSSEAVSAHVQEG